MDAALAGRDVLAVMPTSAGKSVCYQVPALALAARTGGITLVVSPLISSWPTRWAPCARWAWPQAASTPRSPACERASVLHGIASGALALVYVAPERLDDPAFLETVAARGVAPARRGRGALHLAVGQRLQAQLPAHH